MTLVELMVTLALLAIMLSFAVPSIVAFRERAQVSSLVNDFNTSVTSARAKAIAMGVCVSMCRTDDPSAAAPVCNLATGANWEVGWLVFTNRACDPGASNPATAGELIDVRVGDVNGATLVSGATNESGRRLMFDSRGMLSFAVSEMSFAARSPGSTPNLVRAVCLNAAGRVRVGDSAC
jgi:type IV fimbrial biogenesis protein FimT